MKRKRNGVKRYQWIVMLYLARLRTFTVITSPLRAYRVGPGNNPLIVMIVLVEQSLV